VGSTFRCDKVFTTSKFELDGVFLGRTWSIGLGSHKITIEGLKGADFFTPFLFADLQVTDEDKYRKETSGAGFIKVTVYWTGPSVPDVAPICPRSIGNGPIHERTKKLTSHCVAFGKSSPMPRTKWHYRPPLPQFGQLEFHFYYANKDLLMARDIMPLTVPDNTDAKRAREFDDDDDDGDDFTPEERAEYKRLQEKEQRRVIKRVKKEHEVKEEKHVDLTVPEVPKRNIVIDLTDD